MKSNLRILGIALIILNHVSFIYCMPTTSNEWDEYDEWAEEDNLRNRENDDDSDSLKNWAIKDTPETSSKKRPSYFDVPFFMKPVANRKPETQRNLEMKALPEYITFQNQAERIDYYQKYVYRFPEPQLMIKELVNLVQYPLASKLEDNVETLFKSQHKIPFEILTGEQNVEFAEFERKLKEFFEQLPSEISLNVQATISEQFMSMFWPPIGKTSNAGLSFTFMRRLGDYLAEKKVRAPCNLLNSGFTTYRSRENPTSFRLTYPLRNEPEIPITFKPSLSNSNNAHDEEIAGEKYLLSQLRKWIALTNSEIWPKLGDYIKYFGVSRYDQMVLLNLIQWLTPIPSNNVEWTEEKKAAVIKDLISTFVKSNQLLSSVYMRMSEYSNIPKPVMANCMQYVLASLDYSSSSSKLEYDELEDDDDYSDSQRSDSNSNFDTIVYSDDD